MNWFPSADDWVKDEVTVNGDLHIIVSMSYDLMYKFCLKNEQYKICTSTCVKKHIFSFEFCCEADNVFG